MKTILVIEDDPSISLGLQEALTAERFSVKVANTGARGLSVLKRDHVDLVILDLRLPDMKGEDICRTIRAEGSNLLILMLTAKKQEADKVLGLEIGADDYMTKPFSVRELTARIHALLRRQGDLSIGTEEVAFGDVEVDFKRRVLTKKKKEVRCTVREFEVLKFLVEHEDQVVSQGYAAERGLGIRPVPDHADRGQLYPFPQEKGRRTPRSPHPHPYGPHGGLQIRPAPVAIPRPGP